MSFQSPPHPDTGYEPLFLRTGLSSTPKAVRQTLGLVIGALDRTGFGGADLQRIETVLAEVLNNVTEHAYPTPGQGRIDLSVQTATDSIVVRVRDQGGHVPMHRLASKGFPPVDVQQADLPEGGFGWALIQSATNKVEYRRIGAENCLTLRFQVTPLA